MFLEKRQPVTHAVAAGAFVLLSPLSSPRPFYALLVPSMDACAAVVVKQTPIHPRGLIREIYHKPKGFARVAVWLPPTHRSKYRGSDTLGGFCQHRKNLIRRYV